MGQTGGSPSSSIGEDTKAGSNEGHGGLGLEGGDPSSAQSAETYVVQGSLFSFSSLLFHICLLLLLLDLCAGGHCSLFVTSKC